MKRKITSLLVAVFFLSGYITATHAAGKGNGGGGGGGGGSGGSTPEGTIYYLGGPTVSMNPDGTNQTVVGGDGFSTVFGNPSIELHNDHRLFLRFRTVTDQYNPDGSQRVELLVLRDDFNPDTNFTPQTNSHLDIDSTLQTLGGQKWLLGDNFISVVARRWSSAEPGATVVEGGIYVLPLDYDADGNLIGLGGLPAAPTVPLDLVLEFTTSEYPRPDVIRYSWNPDASKFVYSKYSDPYAVWVSDLDGAETLISLDPGHSPQWSPDGATIVYGVAGGFKSVAPDGKRLKWILQQTSDWSFYYAHFSPDSDFLVFTGQSKLEANHDIFRMNVNGRDLVNLTNTPTPAREQTLEGYAGWR